MDIFTFILIRQSINNIYEKKRDVYNNCSFLFQTKQCEYWFAVLMYIVYNFSFWFWKNIFWVVKYCTQLMYTVR